MSKLFIEDSTLTAIGDAIRAKTGGTEPISPLDMPTVIEGISAGGGSSKLAKIVDRTVTEITTKDLEGVTEIGPYAFYGCDKMTRVVFPDGIVKIGEAAFCLCSSVTEFDFSRCTTIPILADYNSFGGTLMSSVMKIPSFLIDEWKVANNWDNFADRMIVA